MVSLGVNFIQDSDDIVDDIIKERTISFDTTNIVSE